MTKERKRFARIGLRFIAARILSGERRYGTGGLCGLALHWLPITGYNGVCDAIRPHLPAPLSYICKPNTRWEQRAMFALLLAESLED